jgi:prepilin-type N-terminal cleavage/methylation domain-containing protein
MIRREQGVTLIELLIAMVIAALLVAAMYSFFLTQQRTYAVQDNVAEMQQNGRMALLTLVRNIRMAGYGAPAGCTLAPVNNTTGSDGIYVSDHSVIEMLPDSEIFYAELTSNVSAGAGAITVTKTNIDNDTNNHHDFAANKGLIISDGTNTEGLLIANSYSAGDPNITFSTGYTLQHNYSSSNTRVFPAIVYDIKDNELRENLQPLALNIEDIQFSFEDSNGVWYCTGISGDQTTPPTDIASIRVVEINVVAKTNVQDAKETTLAQPSMKDHKTNLNGPDGFRRRTFSTKIHLRNRGL